jgi:ribosomal protein S17
MLKEFKILVDIYSEPDKEGKQNLVKRNVVKKKSINLHDIESIEELTGNGTKILKSICAIEYKGKTIVVKHRYDEMHKMMRRVEGATKPIGFIYKKKQKNK